MNPEEVEDHNRKQAAMLILDVRLELDQTQPEFAEHFGLGDRHERNVEHGDANTSLDVFLRVLARAKPEKVLRMHRHLRDLPFRQLAHLFALTLPLFA